MDQIDEIRRQMALIRHELHQDVSGVIKGAEKAFDWRSYIRESPWVSTGLAMVTGYLLVPGQARTAEIRNSPPPDNYLPQQETSSASGRSNGAANGASVLGVGRWAFSVVAPIALQAAQTYASILIEDMLTKSRRSAPSGNRGPAASNDDSPRSASLGPMSRF